MTSENRFLRDVSTADALWISVHTVVANLPLVLAIACAFSVPVDIVTAWVVQKMSARAESEAARILWTGLAPSFSFGLNLLAYAALAWAVGQIVEGQRPTVRSAVMRLSGSSFTRILGTLVYVHWIILKPVAIVGLGCMFVATVFGEVATQFALLALSLTILFCATFRYINYSFGEFPAIFENTVYRAAAERSRFLVKGRRVRLFFILVLVFSLCYGAAVVLTEGVASAAGWPAPGLDSVLGIARMVYTSLVNSVLLSLAIVFQTLLYFRLRREKHDLTFFDLSATGTLEPARTLAEAAR